MKKRVHETMMQIKTFLLRILRLRAAWSIVLLLLSLTAVIYIFVSGRNDTVFAYIIYVVSAYALTAFIVSFPNTRAEIRASIHRNRLIRGTKSLIYSNKYGNQLMTDVSLRVKVSLYISLGVNFAYVVLRLIAAVQYTSLWFGAEALFYIAYSVIRFMLLRNMNRSKGDLKREYQTYRFCGYLLFVLNAALTGVVYQMIHDGRGYRYPGLLIYLVALYAFFCLSVAVVNLIKFRKYNSPILSAVKMINLVKTLVAMFTLQIAMFASFGGDKTSELIMNRVCGGLLCFGIFAIAVMMVVRANKNLAKMR